MSEKIGLVLLPGGGMSDWIWERCILEFKLPSIALKERIQPNNYQTRKNARLDDCLSHILKTMEKAPFEKYIIIANSGAGALAANIGKRIPEKTKHIIYIAANIPGQNKTMMSGLPLPLRLLNIIAVKKMLKKDSIPNKKIEKTLREKFCNTCDEETIEFILKHELLSEPLCVLSEKMDWTDYPNIPQTYVILTKDQTINVERQKMMAENLNIKDLRTIESDHMVMLSHPAELMSELDSIFKLYL